MFDFGPVRLGRTLDADTSEHDLQSDMATVTRATCCRITIGRGAAKLSRTRGAGRVGDRGVPEVREAGCDGHSEMNAD